MSACLLYQHSRKVYSRRMLYSLSESFDRCLAPLHLTTFDARVDNVKNFAILSLPELQRSFCGKSIYETRHSIHGG